MNKIPTVKNLEQIGLTKEQAEVYNLLVSEGTLSARRIGILTGINRSLIYRITKQLVDLGLIVENSENQAIISFTPLHPSALSALVAAKATAHKDAEHAYDNIASTLGSQFNLTFGKPNVRFLEGVAGIRELTTDIIRTKKPMRAIRSPFDGDTPETRAESMHLLEARAKAKIRTQLISPTLNPKYMVSPDFDKKYLIDRVRVTKDKITNNAQLYVYGNKVAYTSFGKYIMTVIIEDAAIAETQATIFDTLFASFKDIDTLTRDWHTHTDGKAIDDTINIHRAHYKKADTDTSTPETNNNP